MNKNETIDYAIAETLKVHPDFAPKYSFTIYETIRSGVNPVNFTSHNNARRYINGASSKDFLYYILEEAAKIYSAILEFYPSLKENKLPEDRGLIGLHNTFPRWKTIKNEVEKMLDAKTNLFNDYILDPNRLCYLVEAVISTRFNPSFYPARANDEDYFNAIYSGSELRKQIDEIGKRNIYSRHLMARIEQDYQAINHVSNPRVNYESVNRCLQEVINGSQIKHSHNEYALGGTLFATQDIGKRRNNQEDSVIIMTHPANENFKLLAVADGVGGGEYGEQVSNYAVKKLSEWFSRLPVSYYADHKQITSEFRRIVEEINKDIYEKYNKGYTKIRAGTTLVGAIVGKEITTVLNVGDSRAYAVSRDNIKLITEDESPVWLDMKIQAQREGRMIDNNDISNLRFSSGNNVIANSLGFPNIKSPQVRLVYNDTYDRLLLFSDGIHDLLSTNDIYVISRRTSPEELTQMLVDHALNVDAIGYDEDGNRKRVNAGKDNATAAGYIRR